jgi:hypothetical protein
MWTSMRKNSIVCGMRNCKGDGDCEEIGGMKIGRGPELLGENLPQRHFVHHKSHMTRLGFEPGPPR